MDKVLVVNASPLIFLSRIDRLDLLLSLAKSLVVPEAVFREIQAGSERDGAVDRIRDLSSMILVEDREVPDRIRFWALAKVGE